MPDSPNARIEALSAHLEGLEAAVEGLASDPSLAVSVRRIARSLETAARMAGLHEIEGGAIAIQRAGDEQLAASVANFLARIGEIRGAGPERESTILIVEDNRTVAVATRAYLKAPGRRIHVAPTAAAALTVLESERVDLVVLDLILPDRDGRDVLVQMREHAETSPIPVVVLSATSNRVAQAECRAVGADEFVEKPADPEALRAAVDRLLDAGRRRRDAVRDEATGLPNRAGLVAIYVEERKETLAEGVPLAIGVLGVDSLPEVTRALGPDAGNRFLVGLSALVQKVVGERGRVGRWETGRLVSIVPGATAEEGGELFSSIMGALAEAEAFAEFREAGIDLALSGGMATANEGDDLRAAVSDATLSTLRARVSDLGAARDEREADPDTPHQILLVEDDRVTSTLLRHRLVRDGHVVVDFGNGADAFEWAKNGSFDLAVLDVKVPGMDGFELLAKLRSDARFTDVPILMLTGMGSEADVIRGLELGADDYMLKPFSPSELLARVRRLLHHPGSLPDTSAAVRATGAEA